jgi:hypothetical protein
VTRNSSARRIEDDDEEAAEACEIATRKLHAAKTKPTAAKRML